MAKPETDDFENAAPQVVATVPLEEFVRSLSVRDQRVELVHGFWHTERVAGRNHDAESAYESRFLQFANAPA